MTDLDRRVVTIRWNGLHYKVDKPSWMGGKVMTLDDLEAWLKEQRNSHSGCDKNCFTFDDLLTQVQAMRGET